MRHTQSGMTLVELMVVCAIVAILAAIAYPSYRAQILRSHRTDGKVALQQAAQQLERCFTRTQAFNDATCTAPFPINLPSGFYQITITPGANPATDYTLTALPQAGQLDDVRCLNLTLTDANLRGATGPDGQTCW